MKRTILIDYSDLESLVVIKHIKGQPVPIVEIYGADFSTQVRPKDPEGSIGGTPIGDYSDDELKSALADVRAEIDRIEPRVEKTA